MLKTKMQLDINNLPGILRLSPDIRRAIYLHAGLGPEWYYTGEEMPRVFDLADLSGLEAMAARFAIEQGLDSFYGLLLSCQTIYSEVSALLYSTHWFVIHYRTRGTLQPLRALTPHALASLTNLRIVLNQASCHQQTRGQEGYSECCGSLWNDKADPATGHMVYQDCLRRHEDQHDPPLERSNPSTRELLEDWHAAAAHLAAYITPGQLELALVCDLDHGDLESVELVLAGLCLLPRLTDCHVRLCNTRHSRLQELAQAAALRARGIITSSGPPPLLDSLEPRLLNLPRELRLRVLEYTDLVTPWNEVTWSRAGRRGYRLEQLSCSPYGAGCSEEFHHGCQFIQCSTRPWPEPSVGCFCRRLHSAFSLRCKCWSPPTRLFLICRTLYFDANFVFYSRNRFIVMDNPGPYPNPFVPWPPRDYPHKTFAASHFLRHVVPRYSVRHLRFLELVFSPFDDPSQPRAEHPALQDWVETLDWANSKLNLPALTLRIIMARNRDFWPQSGLEMTRAQGKEVLAAYNRVIAPLERLGTATDNGLARFYAELEWPWLWTERVGAKLGEEGGPEWLQSKRQELKTRVERAIMGERYDRFGSPVGEPHMSVWSWSCLRHG